MRPYDPGMTTTSLPAGVGTVEVPGGTLAFEVHPGSTAPVLAVHGVSSQRRLWNWLRAEAPEVTLIAPDLRGRADSVDVAGPYGMARHAADMIAVLNHLGVTQAHVVGMSMGGFVGVELAARHPDRVRSLTLIDGGFPMPVPPGATREGIPVAFADRVGRLAHPWASVEDYLTFFVTNTAPLLDPADPLLRDNLSHDLAPDGQVRLSADALIDDVADVMFGENPFREIDLPIRLVYAEWGAGPGSPPAYTAERLDDFRPPLARATFLPGLDHASTIMSSRGAAATAELLREALA